MKDCNLNSNNVQLTSALFSTEVCSQITKVLMFPWIYISTEYLYCNNVQLTSNFVFNRSWFTDNCHFYVSVDLHITSLFIQQ